MGVVSHSVANPTFKTIKRYIKREPNKAFDIYGEPAYARKKLFYVDYNAVTSASKGVPDFKEQDFIRTKTQVQKRAYYSASKMIYSQAGDKANEVVSFGVTSSKTQNTVGLYKSLAQSARGAAIPWSNITGISSATSVANGEFNVVASKNGTSTWELTRPVLWFNLNGLPNHVSYSAAYLDVYVTPDASTVTDDPLGWRIQVQKWTGAAYASTADFNDFDTNTVASAFTLTGSSQIEGYSTTGANRIPLDNTWFTYLNDNPSGSGLQGQSEPGIGLMVRPILDTGQALLADPTGVNEVVMFPFDDADYYPRLYLEYQEPTIPGFKNADGTQRLGDHDGTAMDVNDKIVIGGALSNIPNSNHDITGSYSQNFLAQCNGGGGSLWQVAVSSSGVDEANSELTLVNNTNGWNFKIKKKSMGNLTGSLFQFNKVFD